MRKHAKEVHGDKNIAYRMEILKTFKKPMERQVYESIKIINSKTEDDFPLNSKNENIFFKVEGFDGQYTVQGADAPSPLRALYFMLKQKRDITTGFAL